MEQKPQNREKELRMQAMRACRDREAFHSALCAYIFFRLNLPGDTRESSLYRLVVFSVKLRMPGMDAKRLEARLATADCHQTSYVVSKKNLLMMEIERGLGVRLDAGTLDHIETTADYARALWEAMQHGEER